jgi:hypothetical protein
VGVVASRGDEYGAGDRPSVVKSTAALLPVAAEVVLARLRSPPATVSVGKMS